MWKFALTTLWLIAMSTFDLVEKRVPVWLLAAGGIPAMVISLYVYVTGKGSWDQILFGMIPGGLLLAVAAVTKKVGWADGIVLLIIGLLTNMWECMTCFIISLMIMSAVSLFLVVLKRVRKNTTLPYIPFLCAGYLLRVVVWAA